MNLLTKIRSLFKRKQAPPTVHGGMEGMMAFYQGQIEGLRAQIAESQAVMSAQPSIVVRDPIPTPPMPDYNDGVAYPPSLTNTANNWAYITPFNYQPATPMMYLDVYEVQWNQGNIVCLKAEHWVPGVWAGTEGKTCHYQGLARTIASIDLDQRIVRFTSDMGIG